MPLRRTIIAVAVIAFALAIAYVPLFGNTSFVWDDSVNITDNSKLKPVTTENILSHWKGPFLKLYIPVTYTAWSLIWQLVSWLVSADPDLQTHAWILHLINLLFHILNTLLVFSIVVKLVDDRLAALLGAMLFGLHPMQVEAVAYITELKTLLAFFFSLLAIHQYLQSHAGFLPFPTRASFHALPHSGPYVRRWLNRQDWHALTALALFILAILSKPVSIVVPVFLLIINHFFLHKDLKSSLKTLALWFIAAAVLMVLTVKVQPPDPYQFIAQLWQRPFIALDAASFYLWKLFIPDALGIDYGRTPEWVLNNWWGYCTGIISAGVLVLLIKNRRKYHLYLGCYLLFLAGFLPMSGIMTFVFQRFSTVADRYLYFSMLGPALAAAIFLQKEKNLVHLVPVFLMVLFLMMATYAQTKTWDNGIKLYTHAIRLNPSGDWIRNNLANCIGKEDLIGAIFLYQEAISLRPDYIRAIKNLGIAISKVQNYHPSFDIAWLVDQNSDPRKEEPKYFQAGIEAFQAKDIIKSVWNFGKALSLNMINDKCYNNIGILSILSADFDGAAWLFRSAIAIHPENPEALNNLAIATYYLGEKDKSLEFLNSALVMKKDSPIIRTNRDVVAKAMTEKVQEPEQIPIKFEYLLQK